MKKVSLILSVMLVASLASAAVYDDFETGTVPDSAKWTNSGNWGGVALDTWNAWSLVGGTAAIGNMTSNPIAVPTNGYVTLRTGGYDVPDKQGAGFWGAPEALWVEVRGGSSAGPVLAKMNSYATGGFASFKVDARGYSTVVVVGVDNGNAWISMDDVATTTGVSHQLITNGSLENGLTGWTTTGTAWDKAYAKDLPYWESVASYATEGGLFASTEHAQYLPGDATGTITSSAITVTQQSLSFSANGTSGGPWGGGANRFNLLDGSGNVIAFINSLNAQGGIYGGAWLDKSFDLLAAGLNYGDTCYFQAVDGDTGSYGWIAFDNVRLTGAVPEPATITLLGFGMAYCLKRRK
ncbi:MAG: hypothetical protein UV78_C0002G0009 [Parcubacteria group bacterium GW2011_GWA2_43_17]|nr:MAG: hypothetical protein UV78_C0002G0009 [Parcubacteria group bacterium GW2011_GWA2_43_17]OHB44913.1 MAG: hypothetical protein A2Y13_11145 [Planctomycetes bacterium GWC2_45_44]